MIAMALILGPALLIADEPTTALDVTTQAEILRLIRDLQRERQTAVLFITHDLGVVSEIADQVAVLQRGDAGGVRDRARRPHASAASVHARVAECRPQSDPAKEGESPPHQSPTPPTSTCRPVSSRRSTRAAAGCGDGRG
jgi:peptide/nickel transport system ATP-binding protein